MKVDILEELSKLCEDDALVEKLRTAESVEAGVKILNEYGVAVTEDEFLSYCESIMPKQDGELSEEDLEVVAGGKKSWYSRYCDGFYTGMDDHDGWGWYEVKDKGFAERFGYSVGSLFRKKKK